MRTALALAALMFAAAALAQHQDRANPHAAPANAEAEKEAHADPHAGHVLSFPADSQSDIMPGTDHSMMEHGHNMNAPSISPCPEMETPPPVEAGSGPPRAADAIWGAEAMAASREELRRTHGNFPVFWFQGDRLETQVKEDTGYLWDVQGYYGGPTDRLWFKSEGEGKFGSAPEDAEVQALYARAFMPFWDLQVGVRQDIARRDTTHAVIGVQGLAPYMFELDAALFISHRGDVTLRIEGELDQRVSQRLTLQPRIEAGLSVQDVPHLGIGAGLDQIEAGVRLRYEVVREFVPYFGIEQAWRIGRGAEFARSQGEDPSVTSFVAGIRFWF